MLSSSATLFDHPYSVKEWSDDGKRPKPVGHEDLNEHWVGAGHLKVGDKIKQADGTTGVVANVVTLGQTREMFNLTVIEAHTFYVGQDGWLVHNCDLPASSASQAAKLKEYYRQAEKYGQGGVKQLENGRFRFYGQVELTTKPGEMAGRRLVREWDPATGQTRTWHETVDQAGNIRQVRPQRADNTKTHYTFGKNGNYTGKW